MHLIGGAILSALLAVVPVHPAKAADTVPQPAPATGPQPAPADQAAPATSADRLTAPDLEAWLDGFMPYALEKNDVAGAVVVVVKDGKVLLEKGYGYADLAKRTPVDPERTLFRPGSVSKLFTWTAVMQLVEQGKIDLDQDVNTYLDFKIPPYQGKPVTMRNIMTHTAGFEEAIRGLIATDPKGIQPLGDTLKHWVPARVYAPGSTSAYSNYATAVAGYIVAARLRRAVRPTTSPTTSSRRSACSIPASASRCRPSCSRWCRRATSRHPTASRSRTSSSTSRPPAAWPRPATTWAVS